MTAEQKNMGSQLDPQTVLKAFLEAEDVSVLEAYHIYRWAGLRPVPLGDAKMPIVSAFALHQHDRDVFRRATNIGIATGDLGGGIVCFDHDSDVYRDAFLSCFPPTLGIGRNGQLRKSFIIIDGEGVPTKRTTNPKEGHKELGCLKAGQGDCQHQVVVPPGVWRGANGETQTLEVIVREDPVVMPTEMVLEGHKRLQERVDKALGIDRAPRPIVAPTDVPVASTGPSVAKEMARAALGRLCDKLRGMTSEGTGRTDALWRYALIVCTYVRAGLLDKNEARRCLLIACSEWGGRHTIAHLNGQIDRAMQGMPSQKAIEDIERWVRMG
jgi:hypothetical protein